METNKKLKIVAVLCALVAGLSAAAPAKIIYVDDDASMSGDGSSWANAFTWLQHALAAAQVGDEIRVAQGSYRPDQGLPSSWPRGRSGDAKAGLGPQAVFALKNGVAIIGGFASLGADDPDARDPQRYQTVLTGDLRGNDVDLWGPGNPLYESLRADNSVHVVGSVKTDATAVLDGFVIESAVDSGLYNQGGSPQITNCVFRRCSGQAYGGGGLTCDGGQPLLSNCLFEENSAKSRGGAIYVLRARLALSDCRFIGNWATLEGGAICSVDSDLTLTGCTFEKNAALEGGAIHQTAGTLTLVECTFEANAANDGGAAAFAVEAASMTRCVFAGNWATDSGGALENAGSPLTLDESAFSGNVAANGGAIYAQRLTSRYVAAGPGTTLTRCLFAGNRAHSTGGALCSGYAAFTILGCMFADNQAPTAATLTWPLLRAEEVPYSLSLDNCIVWDGQRSIAASFLGGRPGGMAGKEKVDIIVRYSDVQGGWPGEGNIDADPCFAAPGYWVDATSPKIIVPSSYANAVWVDGDYHLKSQAGRWDPAGEGWVLDDVTSPCIDAGDPNTPVADEPEPNGGRINMGAYGGTPEASMSLDTGS
jgi:predicted outer membrane repeat protein